MFSILFVFSLKGIQTVYNHHYIMSINWFGKIKVYPEVCQILSLRGIFSHRNQRPRAT